MIYYKKHKQKLTTNKKKIRMEIGPTNLNAYKILNK